jgi:N-methylhydantoinase A/oxoprolinase/acetone carboxylase beta subunit
VSADDVIAVVDAEMTQALRAVTVERGVDPRHLALVAFGGAGPLHACSLAEGLGMRAVIVPAGAGVLSAVGLVTAPVERELVRSWPGGASLAGLDEAAAELADEVVALVAALAGCAPAEVDAEVAFDCRYGGQGHELRVGAVADFAEEHRRRNGYDRPGTEVEVVAIRARGLVPSGSSWPDVASRTPVTGPAVVADPDCTIHVPAGWVGRVGELGALVLEREDRP